MGKWWIIYFKIRCMTHLYCKINWIFFFDYLNGSLLNCNSGVAKLQYNIYTFRAYGSDELLRSKLG